MSADPIVRIVMDVKLRRPACVLLQAVFRGDRSIVSSLFDERTWLTAPTDDMQMVAGPLSDWRALAAEINAEGRAEGRHP